MGAPTWPPTPEEGYAVTRKEYGEDARAVLDFETDEEAEEALLAHFLFRAPDRELASGESVGLGLDEVGRPLSAWLRMLSGREAELGVSDPSSTDGARIFLPRALPGPREEHEDALLYRVLGLVQLGLLELGLLRGRSLLAELHRDWVLRSCYHALAFRYVLRHWCAHFPGIAQDIAAAAFLEKAWILRVNLTQVPAEGLPVGFRPLYAGLSRFLEEAPPGHPDAEPAREAVAAVDAIASPAAAPLVIQGRAQALRQAYRRLRLGPPPLPYLAGAVRPEWHLHDLAAELRDSQAWREGPKPLAILKRAMERGERKGGRGSRLPEAIRRRMRAGPASGPAPAAPELDLSDPPPPSEGEGRVYDEWDAARGAFRVDAVRVTEEPGHTGPLARYEQLVRANAGPIREVRRRFAALRTEERWIHGLPDGTELDLSRAVSAVADIQAGFTPRVDWYKRFQRSRESVAILVHVDLSGSTQGRIIHLEQEALILFAEGLSVLGFPHAFYGFSSRGPARCTLQRLKAWEEGLAEDEVQKRLANLQPGGATRLGAFLRHGTWQLAQRPEARRLFFVLSDGRPHDPGVGGEGAYTDRAAVADCALAVRAAHRQGVFVHALSLDTRDHAEDELRTIFGPERYLLLERAEELPRRLPEVFERLIR